MKEQVETIAQTIYETSHTDGKFDVYKAMKQVEIIKKDIERKVAELHGIPDKLK